MVDKLAKIEIVQSIVSRKQVTIKKKSNKIMNGNYSKKNNDLKNQIKKKKIENGKMVKRLQ